MSTHFDREAEDAKLAHVRAQEEEDLVRILSEKHGIPYVDLTFVPLNMDALRVIAEKDARESEAVAFDKSGKHLSVAMRDPESDVTTGLLARLAADGFVVSKFLVSHASLAYAFGRYTDLSTAQADEHGVFLLPEEHLQERSEKLGELLSLRSYLLEELSQKSAQTSLLLEDVLGAAILQKASDIHFEPGENSVRMRLRLNGVLTDIVLMSPHAYRLLNSRIKVLSDLKLNITDRAQDGRFTVRIGEREIEMRVSAIPGNYGESLVLRLLDPEATRHDLSTMGMHPKLLARVREEISRPNGMLLTTGPTGSGKTTTLYACMREVHTPEIKIVTIEDPVEYHLPGIVQTQVEGTEYTFASGLRSVLRQDPDIIMVGEIRDAEVAEVAIQAALTGHLVFSTLHTNDAPGAFPRLVDLDVDPKSFASAISVAMAQRLVRTLDPDTRVKRAATVEEVKIMEKVFGTLEDKSLMPASFADVYEPGDPETGYKGRVGVFEAIFMDDELGTFLRDNPSTSDIAKQVVRQGFPTMAQDAMFKVLAGVTSFEEVARVVDLPRV